MYSKKRLKDSHEMFLFVVIIVMVLFLIVATQGRFIRTENLINMLTGYAAFGVMAAGVLVVIISGGIDVSFMATATVAQYLMASYMLKNGGNFVLIILISMAAGAILGTINAFLVSFIKAPTLIITIATMNVYYGILMYLTNGVKLFDFPAWFAAKTTVMRVAVPIGMLVIVMVITWYLLNRTKMGRRIYAVGGNQEAARRIGINVLKVQIFVYAYVGITAALGAVVQCYLIQQVALNDMFGNEMDVIAMVVLGGASLSGGKGTAGGTVLGMLLVAILSNGLVLTGVSSYYQDLVIGAVILISFCLTGWRTIRLRRADRKGGRLLDA